MDKLVALASFISNPEAEVVKSYLESQGIACTIDDSLSNQLLGGYIDIGGARMSVMEKDLPQARQVLEEGGFGKYLL